MANESPETLTMTLETGDVVIRLRSDLAPNHVARIAMLANKGFYDGVVFHRVIDGFMAQGGDPSGTGSGGSKEDDLAAEFSREPHVRGVCSMARTSNPNSANSQFFICFDDATLPRRAIYRLGRSDRGHGTRRCASQGRAAAQPRQDPEGARGLSVRRIDTQVAERLCYSATSVSISQSWNSFTGRVCKARGRHTNQ